MKTLKSVKSGMAQIALRGFLAVCSNEVDPNVSNEPRISDKQSSVFEREKVMKKLVKSAIVLMVTGGMLFTSAGYASRYIVFDTTIHIYASDREYSTAHIIVADKPLYDGGNHPWCGDSAYIRFEDKELFATALAASMSGKKVSFQYEDAAPTMNIAGHKTSKCKVFSIWQ